MPAARNLRTARSCPAAGRPSGLCPSGAIGETTDVEGLRVGLGPARSASTPSDNKDLLLLSDYLNILHQPNLIAIDAFIRQGEFGVGQVFE